MQIVVLNGTLSESEQDEYIRYAEKKYPNLDIETVHYRR